MDRLCLIGENHGQPFKKARVDANHPFVAKLEGALNKAGVTVNPSDELLTQLTLENGGVATATGGVFVVSRIKARSGWQTRDVSVSDISPEIFSEIFGQIGNNTWLAVPRTMCQAQGFETSCMVVAPTRYARIAYMWGKTLFPPKAGMNPDSTVIFFPDFPGERRIYVIAEIGLTLVLGSDYVGEAKKGNLRMAMYFMKKSGLGFGVHGSSKTLVISDEKTGSLSEKGVVLVGLSGTGKTALSGSDHGLKTPEKALNHQDDFVVLAPRKQPDGSSIIRVKGTEKGYYLKTEGMGSDEKDPLYKAVLLPGAVCENVAVDASGKPNFLDYETHGTRNGRCVVDRSTIANNDGSIDAKKLSYVILIYRDPFLPPIAIPETPELGAACFLALQSVITSAASQNKEDWGKPVFEAGANPFMVPNSPEGFADETIRFYNIIREGNVQVVILNTGEVGFGGNERPPAKIPKPVSEKIIADYAKGLVSFRKSKIIPGMLFPNGLDEFDPENPEIIDPQTFAQKFPRAREIKLQWMKKFEPFFENDKKRILDAFYASFKN